MNYYNEFDKHAAKWLRNLIAGGMIPAGDVDERSIEDVKPADLRGYTQCHFFAGIGGWPLALQMAGWPADRPVFTGSSPCQSFSTAGKRKGTADKRHLWPVWFELIKACKPPVVFGEQVDAAIKHGWLDLVSDDLGKEGYELGAAVLPACSVGAPHIRKRLFFMAYTNSPASTDGSLAHGINARSQRGLHRGQDSQWQAEHGHAGCDCAVGRVGNSPSERFDRQHVQQEWREILPEVARASADSYWENAEWIWCRDKKYRPIEPGVMPLAYGVSGRVVKIRGYGNAIVPQVAAEVIKAGMEYLQEQP